MPRVRISLTTSLILICGILFAGSVMDQTPEGWEKYEHWGSYTAESLWAGAYWGYVTSAFIHFDVIHLAFNLYWLFILGEVLEKEFGPLKLAGLILLAAVVTSGFQFLISEDTGHGFSGVLYFFFGFMWQARRRFASFQQVITKQVIKVFLIWLVVCIVMTQIEVWSIANAAHFSGLALGAILGRTVVSKEYVFWLHGASAAMLLVSLVPLFWMPYSLAWISYKADAAYDQDNPREAIGWLTKAIEMDDTYAWAYYNRACAYEEIGKAEKADLDFAKALELDPTLFEDGEQEGEQE